MGDRVQQAASQIDMKEGETISLVFDADHPHDGHSDGYEVTKTDSGYDVIKVHN